MYIIDKYQFIALQIIKITNKWKQKMGKKNYKYDDDDELQLKKNIRWYLIN